jgi:hypothetical protein
MDCNLMPPKVKTVSIEFGGVSGNHSQTAVSYGSLSSLTGITDLTQDRIVGIFCYQTNLTPASVLALGCYDNNLYAAASQTCVRNGTIKATIAYI